MQQLPQTAIQYPRAFFKTSCLWNPKPKYRNFPQRKTRDRLNRLVSETWWSTLAILVLGGRGRRILKI